MPKRYMPRATQAIWALESLPVGIQNEKPVKKRQSDMRGKVKSRRLRRPKLSIVKTAGRANRKLMIPKPSDAIKAALREKPELTNISELYYTIVRE